MFWQNYEKNQKQCTFRQIIPTKERSEDAHPLEDGCDTLDGTVDLLHGMCGHQRVTYQCIVGRYCRRHHRVDEDTLLEKKLGYQERFVVIAHVQWQDGRGGGTQLEASLPELVDGIIGQLP